MSENWQRRLVTAMKHQEAMRERQLFAELNPGLAHSPIMKQAPTNPKPAAVLIPIIDRREGPSVLFTLRTPDMPSHPGQISFPGGGIKPPDDGPVTTALRETQEEVGIPSGAVEVVGQFGVHFGGLGYAVTPVVGIIHPDQSFDPCPREVAEIFEVPLEFLLDPTNHIVEDRTYKGVDYKMFAVPYQNWRIWGLTAGIIHTLTNVMAAK